MANEGMMEKMRAAQEAANKKKAEAEAAKQKSEQENAAVEAAKAEKEGKRSELSKDQERVTAELVKAEMAAAKAIDDVAEGEKFAAEQGADVAPEVQAMLDGAKAEAEQAKAAVEAFRVEMDKIKAELAALEAKDSVHEPAIEAKVEAAPVSEPIVEAAPEQTPESKRRALARIELNKQLENDEHKNKEDSLKAIESLELTPEQNRRVNDLLKTIVFQMGGELSTQQIAGTLDSEANLLRNKLLDTVEQMRGGAKLEAQHKQQLDVYAASAEKVAKTNPKVDAIAQVINQYNQQHEALKKANSEANRAIDAAYKSAKAETKKAA